MKCESTDLEIETIVNRIKNEDMDLQPDFQRGEIWTLQKKQKLIDSILRGWKIPPIHVIHNNKCFFYSYLNMCYPSEHLPVFPPPAHPGRRESGWLSRFLPNRRYISLLSRPVWIRSDSSSGHRCTCSDTALCFFPYSSRSRHKRNGGSAVPFPVPSWSQGRQDFRLPDSDTPSAGRFRNAVSGRNSLRDNNRELKLFLHITI